jgi:hypothetical protein
MKLLIILLLFSFAANAQMTETWETGPEPISLESVTLPKEKESIKLAPEKWRMTGNRWVTGGLVFLAGASKGFNETLMFHWKAFRHTFPDANPKWFNPNESWRNKYKNGDPNGGAKFPLSTSALVMFTDQYHLNTFINRAAWTSTVVIKIGEGKKPLKHYVMDFLYYTFCHQAGFALTYYPFKNYRGH